MPRSGRSKHESAMKPNHGGTNRGVEGESKRFAPFSVIRDHWCFRPKSPEVQLNLIAEKNGRVTFWAS